MDHRRLCAYQTVDVGVDKHQNPIASRDERHLLRRRQAPRDLRPWWRARRFPIVDDEMAPEVMAVERIIVQTTPEERP